MPEFTPASRELAGIISYSNPVVRASLKYIGQELSATDMLLPELTQEALLSSKGEWLIYLSAVYISLNEFSHRETFDPFTCPTPRNA
jgi:hypothetical protein